MQVWLDQGLLNKSWKWKASKGKFMPSKNRRRTSYISAYSKAIPVPAVSLTNESEQSKEAEEIESLEKDIEENFKQGDDSSSDLELLEKQIKPRKNSKLFTLGICSLVGAILCLVYGLGYFHDKAVDKTVIIKKHTEDEKISDQDIANSPDEKFEVSQSDEEKMNSIINQGPANKRYTPTLEKTKKTEQTGTPDIKKTSIAPLKHTLELNSSVILEMLWVEPGTFIMGGFHRTRAGHRRDEAEHNVTLTTGFYLGKYEVTQALYEAVMTGNTEGLSATPSNWPNNPNRPVEKVSWNDIQIFLSRLNTQQSANIPVGWAYVLPTEAQWEYACRAGTTTNYSWGDDINPKLANFRESGIKKTMAVGSYRPNPWGFFDMHGNVWEWVYDWYGKYPTGSVIDPIGVASGSDRVARGASWHHTAEAMTRRAGRRYYRPFSRHYDLGFRVSFQKVN
jgi:formylglycine-generating enzyme required for sulfatase activity